MSYEDIINYKYEKSKTHKWMSNDKRAFQFAPFSALNGYEEAIYNASIINDKKRIISTDLKDELNLKMKYISKNLNTIDKVKITYFNKKQGSYQIIDEKIKKIDETDKKIILINNDMIYFDDIVDIYLEKFKNLIW